METSLNVHDFIAEKKSRSTYYSVKIVVWSHLKILYIYIYIFIYVSYIDYLIYFNEEWRCVTKIMFSTLGHLRPRTTFRLPTRTRTANIRTRITPSSKLRTKMYSRTPGLLFTGQGRAPPTGRWTTGIMPSRRARPRECPRDSTTTATAMGRAWNIFRTSPPFRSPCRPTLPP